MNSEPHVNIGHSPSRFPAREQRSNSYGMNDVWGPKPEIAASLSKANNRRYRRPYIFVLVVIILCYLIGIIMISVSAQNDNAAVLLFGAFILSLGFVGTIVLACIYCLRRASAVNDPEHYAIRIEGDQWNRYLTYFFTESRKPMNYFRCIAASQTRIDQLRQRGFGHVVVGSSGLMIDEFYFVSYDAIYVLNAGLLTTTNENGIEDRMIRVHMTNRYQNKNYGNLLTFDIDIFIPPQMPPDILNTIVEFIALKRGHITEFVYT